ncbi:MAG: hypothetical protein J3K34DRAFT_525742 [Monoraphidium minutum]|nr:MAG: hypothetical protein J3K34DRAFT_525742 [Monoraphidium minutum]
MAQSIGDGDTTPCGLQGSLRQWLKGALRVLLVIVLHLTAGILAAAAAAAPPLAAALLLLLAAAAARADLSAELRYQFCEFVWEETNPTYTYYYMEYDTTTTNGIQGCDDPSKLNDNGQFCDATQCKYYHINSCATDCCNGDAGCAALRSLLPGEFPEANWCSAPSTSFPATKCGYVCGPDGAQVQGDPHFVGFDGTPFFFDGYEDTVFALMSERRFQVNALFGGVGPRQGALSTIWMVGFGVRYQDLKSKAQITFEIRVNPEVAPHLSLVEDKAANEAGTLRAVVSPAFKGRLFTVSINGQPRDWMVGSGEDVAGLPEGLSLYFPPATAVNPGDGDDGPIAVFKSPLIHLTMSKESEGALHLDMSARLTLAWRRAGPGDLVKDGDYTGPAAPFAVTEGGLLGTAFDHALFGAAGRGADPAISRLLLGGDAGFDPAALGGPLEAGASHGVHRTPCPGSPGWRARK